MTINKKIRQRVRFAHRRLREWRMIAKGLLSTRHPVLAHIIPTRRCNLSCTYCNEFDDFSNPVPTEEMRRRIDRLAELGTSIITISGGEPLLHPDLDDIIRHMRHRGIISGMITNGYLLTVERIERLNRAGLEHLQISIDNAQPDAVSKKSLKVLDKKLQMLAEHAEFGVNINSVVGSGIAHPEDALTVANRAVALGFSSTLGIIHDGSGQLQPLKPLEREVYEKIKQLGKKSFARFNAFQENIAHGRPNDWRCRAGARYLYICEDGLVHYCSQQRGYPAISLFDYTREQMRHEFFAPKSCAPYCTVSCVQQIAMIDNWRAPQKPLPRTNPPGLESIQSESSEKQQALAK
ncbi:MAG: radical SAM protein [Acidobacteria bacterium]|nr:radical SAM protein [Acidobacteriota bacterium]MCI0621234.1 radical SAM protein [Acidobacteriota bacterium]MCI0718104.1 radical SAM protein [Acidobacteriota bacterium]